MNRIRELRLSRSMSQSQLGTAIGTVRSAISMYEMEQRQLDPATIHALCDYFGCTADYLLGRSSSPRPAVTEEDVRLIEAYRDADPRDRAYIDHLLRLDLPDTATPAV